MKELDMKINVVKQRRSLKAWAQKSCWRNGLRYFDDPPKKQIEQKLSDGELIYRIQELSFGGLTKQTIDRLEALAETNPWKNAKAMFLPAIGTMIGAGGQRRWASCHGAGGRLRVSGR